MSISDLNQINFYRDSVWSVLAGAVTDSASSIVIHDVKEIETWILRLLSAPVPIPNSTRIEVCRLYQCSYFLSLYINPQVEVLSPTVHPPILFALPDHTRFTLVDYPLHLPLELLGMRFFVLFCVILTYILYND